MNANKSTFLLHFLALVLLGFCTSCRGQQIVPAGVEVLPDVIYGKVGDRALHVEIARPKIPFSKPMPVVLWVHGGGWKEGSQKPNVAIAFAAKGWFTASVEYRLSGEAKWPAQIEDCKLAVRWLRANATKWNIDPNRFGAWGISAGGHLVDCLGTMDEKAGFDVGEYLGFSSRVQAVVAESGPTDFTPGSPGLLNAKEFGDLPALIQLLGGRYTENPSLWKGASPIHAVAPGAPPFLLLAGDSDTIVPKAQSERFLSALQKAGIAAELITVKNGNHVLLPAQSGQPADPTLGEIHQKIVKFFEDHLTK